MDLQDAVIIVNGRELKVETVLVHLKADGTFKNAICRLVETEVMRDKLKELGIKITDDEFEEYAVAKRRFWGLAKAQDMNNYCKSLGINMEQWRLVTDNELLKNKVKAAVVGDEKIADFFNNNRRRFKMVTLSRIVFQEESSAREVMEDINKGKMEFSVAARRHSMEENTRTAGGHLGTLKRGSLPAHVDKAVFSARPNDILGPFRENNLFSIYKIEAIYEEELNELVKKEISDRLFADWLQGAIRETRFEKPV